MDTVIYHKNCRDGFGAALAAWIALGDEATYIPAQYGEAPPKIDPDGRVFIVDFSYTEDHLAGLHAVSKGLVVLDHHKTAKEALAHLGEPLEWPQHPGGAYARFDMSKSGAVLAWEYFHPGEALPPLLAYIQDRDLWQWKLPKSREVSAGLEQLKTSFDAWLAYLFNPEPLKASGAAILGYQQSIVEKAARAVQSGKLDGWDVLMVNTPVLISETCEALIAKWGGVAACYFDTNEGTRVWSLRSKEPDGPDVSEIAKKFGGGGHKHAAGFTVPR